MRRVYIYEHAGSRSIGSNLSSSEQKALFQMIREQCTELYEKNTAAKKIYVHKQHTVRILVAIIKEYDPSIIIVASDSHGNKIQTEFDKVIDLSNDSLKEFYIVGNLKNDRFPFSQMKLHSTEEEALAYAQERFAAKPHNTYYVLKTVSAVHPTKPESNVSRFPLDKRKRK